MKHNFVARYCHSYTFFEEGFLFSMKNSKLVSVYKFNFLNLWKKIFLVKLTITEFLKITFTNFDKYFLLTLP